MKNVRRAWIQGAGEMATGAGLALLSAGWQVVLAEVANPLAVRRLVCFSEAVYEGKARVCGQDALCVAAGQVRWQSGLAVVLVDPAAAALGRLAPDVVVDARMTKAAPQPLPCGPAPLIGLGPGFRCGRDAALIVETQGGPHLGQVISQGEAAAYTGVPGPVAGQAKARLLRAPAAGYLDSDKKIGDLVVKGEVVGMVAGQAVISALDGCLRGLVHRRAELIQGEKVGDVDPRGAAVDPAALTDKARRVGAGVLEAAKRLDR